MQLAARIFACKSPLNLSTSSIALFLQLLDLAFQRSFISNAPVKTLATKDAQLDDGVLGVKAVKEVIIGATDLKAAVMLWARLLEPRRPSAPGLWELGDGPSIRVIEAGGNKLQGLVVSVVSLRRAKAFLREKGLLGSVSGKEVTIDPAKIHGMNIRLVE